MKKSRALYNILFPVLLLLAFVALWWGLAVKADSEYILPPPAATLEKLWEVLSDSAFYAAFGATLGRCAITFVLSFLAAFGFALLARNVPPARTSVEGTMSVLRAFPTLVIALWLVAFAPSRVVACVVAGLVMLPTLFSELSALLGEIDPDLAEMAKLYRVPTKRVLFSFYIPVVLPSAVKLAGAGLALTLKLMVAAEVLAQTANSLGGLMNLAKTYLETAELLALLLVTVAAGLLFEGAAKLISRRIGRWKA